MVTMKAIRVNEPGGSDKLVLEEVPVPSPGPGQVLVALAYAGVNFIDIYFREGRYPKPVPFTAGLEGSGTVEAVGEGVTKVGDKVAFPSAVSGSYAQKAVVNADGLVVVPDGISLDAAATAMIQGMTGHYLVKGAYKVKSGDSVLVHAAAGGTGQLICRIAKLCGASLVIGTTSTEEKAAIAKEAGADEVVLYSAVDFVEETKRLTQGKGVQAVYDGVGKSTFVKNFNVLAPRGTVVLFGAASGAPDPLDLNLLSKGSYIVTRPSLFDYIRQPGELDQRAGEVFKWIQAGQLKININDVLPLADAKAAHDRIQGQGTTGKLLLNPNE
eukprot:jgi/Chlat1/3984/Chrsp26S04220